MSDTARPKSSGDKLSADEINQDLPVQGTGGATINGGTTPAPVYISSSDDELYECDASDSDKLEFIGFIVNNTTDGNAATLQKDGVVQGFSGLTVGSRYYVQDSGGIGTSKGTYEVLVGIAISATQLLILKGNMEVIGTDTISGTASSASGLNASDTSTIPTGTRFILFDCKAYRLESTSYSEQNQGQILLIPGILTEAYYANSVTGSTIPPNCLVGVKASISGSTLTCETVNMAAGGGASSNIAGTVIYLK